MIPFILIGLFISVTLLVVILYPKPVMAGIGDEDMHDGFIYQLKPHLGRIAKYNAGIEMKTIKEKIQRKMISAGDPLGLTPDEFIALSQISCLGGVIVLCIPFGFTFFMILISALVGFFLPSIWLSDTVKKRKKSIIRELPDFLDILTLAVEAGLDFGAGLRHVLEVSRTSPLVSEFRIMMQEMKLGTTRYAALKNLATRVDILEVNAFISALIQSDQLGVSLGTTLRIQSDQMRVKRIQQAEKAGAQASVKMLVPLMLFIFPAIFVVIFGPMVIRILNEGF